MLNDGKKDKQINLEKYLKLDLTANLKKIQILAGKSLFTWGQTVEHVYWLLQGSVQVSIGRISLEISNSIIIGDYELQNEISYRISEARAITKCQFLQINYSYFNNADEFIYRTISEHLGTTNRLLFYWMSKLLKLTYTRKNDIIGDPFSLGIVLKGIFTVDRRVEVCKIKSMTAIESIGKNFDLSLIEPYELFQGLIHCQSNDGQVLLLGPDSMKKLDLKFKQFSQIVNLWHMKKSLHSIKVKEIKKAYRKRKILLQSLVPYSMQQKVDQLQVSKKISLNIPSKPLFKSPPKQYQSLLLLKHDISKYLHLKQRTTKKHIKNKSFFEIQDIKSNIQLSPLKLFYQSPMSQKMKAKAKSLTKPASLRVKFDKIKPFSVKDRLKTEGNACYSLLLK